MPFISLAQTSCQEYIYQNNILEIVSPNIGVILYRINRKTKEIQKFVVTEQSTKRNGNNKNVIDRITLYLVKSINDKNIEYNEKDSIILHLTNHGAWWSKRLEKEFIFSWNYLPSRISSLRGKLVQFVPRRRKKLSRIPLLKV